MDYEISIPGLARRLAAAGAHNDRAGGGRHGRSHGQWRSVVGSRPYFCGDSPHVSVSDFVKVAKGRSSRKIQQEFPEIGKRYWGRHFWGRGFFSTTSGNVTDEVINASINDHADAHKSDNETNITLE